MLKNPQNHYKTLNLWNTQPRAEKIYANLHIHIHISIYTCIPTYIYRFVKHTYLLPNGFRTPTAAVLWCKIPSPFNGWEKWERGAGKLKRDKKYKSKRKTQAISKNRESAPRCPSSGTYFQNVRGRMVF